MSSGPRKPINLGWGDHLTAIDDKLQRYVLHHTTFGTYLGDGIWSQDPRPEVYVKVNEIGSAPTFSWDELPTLDFGPVDKNAVEKASFKNNILAHAVLPDLPDNRISPNAVRDCVSPNWRQKK